MNKIPTYDELKDFSCKKLQEGERYHAEINEAVGQLATRYIKDLGKLQRKISNTYDTLKECDANIHADAQKPATERYFSTPQDDQEVDLQAPIDWTRAEASRHRINYYESIAKAVNRLKRYRKQIAEIYKEHIDDHREMQARDRAAAQELISAYKNKWQPALAPAVAAQDWVRATELYQQTPAVHTEDFNFLAGGDQKALEEITAWRTEIFSQIPPPLIIQAKINAAHEQLGKLIHKFQAKSKKLVKAAATLHPQAADSSHSDPCDMLLYELRSLQDDIHKNERKLFLRQEKLAEKLPEASAAVQAQVKKLSQKSVPVDNTNGRD